TILFEATAPNSYTQTATFPLAVSTPFSQGFYILKETADGNTELDLLTDDGLVGNLMKSLLGAPIAGKPVGLSVIYDNGYIDEADQEMKADNMVHVFTEQDYRAFRTEDMYQTLSRENLMFEPIPADETFCAAMTDMNGIIFLSNKGFYRSRSGVSSGKLGVPDIDGGSKFIQSLAAGSAATVFWNEETHGISEMTEGDISDRYSLPLGIRAEDLECIASGINYSNSGDMAWFLCLEQSSGKRLLYLVEAIPFMELFPGWWMYDIDVQVQLVSEDKHLATGSMIAGNGLDASVIYVADNNALYLYDLKTGTETPFTLQGLEGEITYISNNYLNRRDYRGNSLDGNFNYLIVATRIGDGYKLYFYDKLIGGIPTGGAKEVIEGTSSVAAVRYISTALT
ncbi:MAG: hypothetical protein K2I90_09170, partial [Odoribacter sp.]|nr:hypothetical protein [Odoribacter sp.]